MKVSELRIGNWVNVKHHHNDRVSPEKFEIPLTISFIPSEDELIFNGQRVDIEFCSGVPITEQWLLDFGLIRISSSKIYEFINSKIFDGKSVMQINEDIINQPGYYLWLGDDPDGVPYLDFELKYVHQIQNLYFALTGQELKIV